MAKITIDTKGLLASEEDVQRAFQVATRTYDLLREAGKATHRSLLELVEIIKITTGRGGADFQVVYTLPVSPSSFLEWEKLKVVAEWNGRDDYLVVREEKAHEGKYIGHIKLPDKEIDTFARALVRAIQMGFEHRRSQSEKLIEYLSQTAELLEASIETPVEA